MPTTNLQIHNTFKYNSASDNFNLIQIQDLFNTVTVNEAVITKNHKINFYVLIIITEDIGRHAIDFNNFYYTKGTILAIRKDQMHRFYKNNEVRGYVLFVKEEFLNSYLNEQEVAKTIQMFNELLVSPKTQLLDQELIEILCLLKAIETEFLKISDNYSLKIIRSLVHILITLIHRIKAKGYNKVQLSNYLKEFIKFQNLVEKNYSKTKKVVDYANKLGFSSKKLNTIVQYITNKTVKAFIDDVVIIKAKRYLLHSNLSVKEVAFKLGFKDPANLYKYFKKHTSFTPEAYRKRYSE